MKYINIPLYIIDKMKRFKYIDMTFWNLEELKYFCKRKRYKKYKEYINILKKYHIM